MAPAKRDELFGRIHNSIRRLTVMLDEVLAISRFDSGRAAYNPSPVDLRDMLSGLVDEIRLGDRDAHPLSLHLPETPPPLVTDPAHLHQILTNLLGNAVRYSPPGAPVAITVAAAGDDLEIVFEDRGVGVPEADRERIFQPFERGSNVGATKGTGLGLSIVRRAAERIGATVRVEPAQPCGSRFILRLPFTPVLPGEPLL
jgi:signal transduction histidine kinase